MDDELDVATATAAKHGLRKGTRFTYDDQYARAVGRQPITGGVVIRVEGNLCWVRYDGQDAPSFFIWRFHSTRELNRFHAWPGKPERMEVEDEPN